jgi:hypothetical protein
VIKIFVVEIFVAKTLFVVENFIMTTRLSMSFVKITILGRAPLCEFLHFE